VRDAPSTHETVDEIWMKDFRVAPNQPPSLKKMPFDKYA